MLNGIAITVALMKGLAAILLVSGAIPNRFGYPKPIENSETGRLVYVVVRCVCMLSGIGFSHLTAV